MGEWDRRFRESHHATGTDSPLHGRHFTGLSVATASSSTSLPKPRGSPLTRDDKVVAQCPPIIDTQVVAICDISGSPSSRPHHHWNRSTR